MFGLGFAEIILIAVLALVFIGPRQLPDVARVIARLINEWKRATSDFTAQFNDMRSDLHNHIENKKTDNTIHSPAAPVVTQSPVTPAPSAEAEPPPPPSPS